MWLLAVFIGVPLIEIALFIQVGGWIGLWPTLAVVILTAIAGTALVRSQGLDALRRIQTSLDRMDNPAEPLAHGAMILVSGMLLLTPGFFTDAIGFALLVPGIRMRVFDAVRARVAVHTLHPASPPQTPRPGGDRVIDGDFQEIDPDDLPPRPSDRPSGWTRP